MIVGGLVGGLVAGNKGRNVLFWTLACGVIPLVLLVLFALPSLPRPGISRSCPHCLRIIPVQADTCAYCRRSVSPQEGATCSACGRPFASDDRFCSHCGAPRG